ncbi:MAG: DHHA1 domain-containing protein, partial [Bacteroidetes bacterium]|nr:DHHA1 domain-containing protein [Bacteroidota bacterium]
LRKTLGTHVHQAGSLVDPEHMRFDFTHHKKVTSEEIRDIERIVNEKILERIELTHHRNIPFDQARKMGALAFFGDKYGDKVNVVQFGDFSMEFCGGTHVRNTSEIGFFKVVTESSIASGVRRVEAVTGGGVEKVISDLAARVEAEVKQRDELKEKIRQLESELTRNRLQAAREKEADLLNGFEKFDGIAVVKGVLSVDTEDSLKQLADELKGKLYKQGIETYVFVLGASMLQRAFLVCAVSSDLVSSKTLHAGRIVNEVALLVGGRGGGRPDFATAGGKEPSKIHDAVNSVPKIVKQFLRQGRPE